ncbi:MULTISPECIES: hypothetical protein [unclassified Brevundimonas]
MRTHALVVSLRDFIRKALDLTPVPRGLDIPPQGPARPSGSKSGRDDAKGGGSGGGGGGMGMGMGMGGSDDVSQHKTG